MARPLRIEYPGALHHVISRGNEQRPIVRDDGDRAKRLEWLRRTVETYGWDLHAFVLMTNHEHLFVETPEPNLSSGMQYLNGSYTSYFNRRWRRSGHLFQGRFKAHIVDSEGYFEVVSRRWYGYRCNEIAEMLGYTSVSSISRSVRQVETNMDKYEELLGLFKKKLAPHARKTNH